MAAFPTPPPKAVRQESTYELPYASGTSVSLSPLKFRIACTLIRKMRQMNRVFAQLSSHAGIVIATSADIRILKLRKFVFDLPQEAGSAPVG
jgi:hypothetical protein